MYSSPKGKYLALLTIYFTIFGCYMGKVTLINSSALDVGSPVNCMITVRQERLEDIDAVRHVNEQAFVRPQEAALVDLLRV